MRLCSKGHTDGHKEGTIYGALKTDEKYGGGVRRLFDLQVASTFRGISPLIKQATSRSTGKIIDVGCGAKPYRGLFPAGWKYLGIDTKDSDANFNYHEEDVIYYDGYTFPLDDAEIDLVFHSEVIEHVYETRHFFLECSRVLKPGGEMIFTVPFQARWHYIPYDYWRFTPSSIQKLLEEAAFGEIEIIPRSRDICVAAYKVLTIGYRLFFSKSWWRMLVFMCLAPIWVTSLLLGQISLHMDWGTKEDCLGYVVRCKKVIHKEGTSIGQQEISVENT